VPVLKLYPGEQTLRSGNSSNPKGCMVDQPEFREGLLVEGRASSPVYAERSSAASSGHSNSRFAMSGVRFVLVVLLLLLNRPSWATGSRVAGQQQPAELSSQAGTGFGTIAPYLGLTIDRIELPDIPPDEAASILASTPL
jgi:hypothetical protein